MHARALKAGQAPLFPYFIPAHDQAALERVYEANKIYWERPGTFDPPTQDVLVEIMRNSMPNTGVASRSAIARLRRTYGHKRDLKLYPEPLLPWPLLRGMCPPWATPLKPPAPVVRMLAPLPELEPGRVFQYVMDLNGNHVAVDVLDLRRVQQLLEQLQNLLRPLQDDTESA